MRTTPFMKRSLTIAGATLILSGSAFGLANAQSTPTATPPAQAQPGPRGGADHQQQEQAFLAALAKRLNVTTDQLQQALAGARQDLGLPANGGFGFGRGPGGPNGGRPGGFGPNLDAAAQFLGVTTDQLRQELPGQTLAAVAQAHGKSATDLATALKNAANQRIDQEVSSGRLTADQAAQRKQAESQRIDQMINQQAPTGQPGPRGGQPGQRGGQPGDQPSGTPGPRGQEQSQPQA